MNNEVLSFRGGKYTSLIPFLLMVAGLLGCSAMGLAAMEAFWVVACVCIMLGMVLASDSAKYFDAIIHGAASPLYITPIFCWIFAGMFASILKASGLGNGLVWMGLTFNIGKGFFAGITFLVAAIYSTSNGSGSSAIVTIGALLYPAGVALGGNPLVMAGAIVSGGAFGDNLAPVSDSTIVAAATMGVDIPGVVKTRLPYTLVAGGISFCLITALGFILDSGVSISAEQYALITGQADPKGLIMLVPAILVIVLAFRGINLILCMSMGGVLAVIMGIPSGLLTWSAIIHVTDSGIGGALIEGISGFIGLIVFIILSAAVIQPMISSGAVGSLLGKIKRFIKTPRQAEVTNWFVIALSAFGLCNNVTSQIVAGPIMKGIAEEYHISLYRAANFSDSVQAMFGYTMPWGGQSILMCATAAAAAATYSWCPSITNPLAMIPFTVHAFVIALVFLFSAVTGVGRKLDEKAEDAVGYVKKNMEENVEETLAETTAETIIETIA
ncbi:Na+/H+ antiporter NhaC family protein [Enterocloster citroniae]|uniref:Na+/H+ antiporter NhaC family protein n=1 Tax=Enterocloster citroniae TaxID=358743 RepID=UPI0022DEB4E2|nr:Na+/H+ antiporter NhaC family protein [Enterocloster citroniae]